MAGHNFKIIFDALNIASIKANRANLHEKSYFAVSHFGLHCLLFHVLFLDYMQIYVKYLIVLFVCLI